MTSKVQDVERPTVDHDGRRAGQVGLILGVAAALGGVAVGPFRAPWGISSLLVIAAILVGLRNRQTPDHRILILWFDWIFIAYFVVRAATEFQSAGALDHSPGWTSLVQLVVYYLATWPARLTIGSIAAFRRFALGMSIPAVPVAMLAVLQLAGMGNTVLLRYAPSPALADRIMKGAPPRATATIGHWTGLGAYFDVVTCLACVVLVLSRPSLSLTRRRSPRGAVIILGTSLIGQMTTVTFATIALAAVILLVTLSVVGFNFKYAIVAVIAGGVGWLVVGSNLAERIAAQRSPGGFIGGDYGWLPHTIAYRLSVWHEQSIPAIQMRPWSGWGAAVYDLTKRWPQRPPSLLWDSPESEWVRAAVSGGYPTLVAEIFVISAVILAAVRARRTLGSVAAPVIVALAGSAVAACINSSFSNVGLPLLFWPLGGAVISISSCGSQKLRSVLRSRSASGASRDGVARSLE